MLTAAGDPTPPTATPLVLNQGYFELNGVNLSCLCKHYEVSPENKPVTVTTMCSEIDYQAITKWHLRATLYQSFDPGATYYTLQACLDGWNNSLTPAPFKVRGYASRAAAANNPLISGFVVPMPFDLIIGDAGTASEVPVDWNLNAPPTVSGGAVTAVGATAGAPGYYTPSGATVPANLAALTGITATPATAWATGSYVITADLLAAHWSGSAWAAGKA
jgi:hypothetical protein